MRIRKHAHLSPPVNGGSAINPEGKSAIKNPYVCQLNQSPWDVLTFPIPDNPDEEEEEDPTQLLPPPPLPPPPPPVDGEDSSMENGSISDCPEAENSGLSMNSEKRDEIIDSHKAREIEFEGNRMFGGSSVCKKKIKERRRSNHHRVQQMKQYKYKLAKKPIKNNNPGRSRVVRAKKAVSSSNPYEYYYYSGFGPRWGRTRRASKPAEAPSYTNDLLINIGDQGESYSSESLENDNATTTTEVDNSARVVFEDSNPARINYESGFDYVDDDEEEEDGNYEEFVRGKRARKPVKARSLKSLM